MNDKQFEDLKQLIEVSNSQSEERMMAEVGRQFTEVRLLINEVIDGSNQQTESIIDHIDKASASSNVRIEDHEERISRLERHAA